jgi:hypothetical protein
VTLEYINGLEKEIRTLEQRKNELVESGRKSDQTIKGWEENAKLLEVQIQGLKLERDRGHTLLARKP